MAERHSHLPQRRSDERTRLCLPLLQLCCGSVAALLQPLWLAVYRPCFQVCERLAVLPPDSLDLRIGLVSTALYCCM
jgi:hypothetical protein